MKHFLSVLIVIFGISLAGKAQHQIKGLIRDAETQAPLPFVSIQLNESTSGTTTDIDGRFVIKSSVPVQKLKVSYLGYEPTIVAISGYENQLLTIKLRPAALNLQEVTIRAGYNPAHRIIKLATKNRKNNDPSQIAAYTCRVYTKTVVTFNTVKPNMRDTLRLSDRNKNQEIQFLTDSTEDKEMKQFLNNNYLFLSESISDRTFMKPDLEKEVVLATRVSGLQKPSFALLATNSQEFSVYKDQTNFFGKNFLSPLSEGSTNKYDFRLENKTYSGSDTIFIISYQPLPGKNFEGLKGQLHISSDGWAVENIIAESNEEESQGIKLQQHYEKIGGAKWFPVQMNTDYEIKAVGVNNHTPMAYSRSYYTNININPEVRRRDFKAVTIKINPDAHKQPEDFWQQYRPDTLTSREKNTYQKIDSLGKAVNMDRKLRFMEAAVSKQLPVGPVSIDLNRLAKFNRYEAVRLGFGAHTNELVSEFFSVGGYAAYGFRDKGFKYGGDLLFNLYKPSGLKLTFAHFEDITESGGVQVPFYNPPLLGKDLRPLLIRNMDKVTHQSAAVSLRMLKYLNLSVGLQQEHKRVTNNYVYEMSTDKFVSDFHFTEAVVGARYAFREKVMQMFNKDISMGTDYPVFWFEYRQGLPDVLQGEFKYQKYTGRAEKSFRFRTLGTTKVTLTGGLVEGNVPYSNLYNGYGAFEKKYHVYTGEGFQTMGLTEFLSDRFTSVFLQHDFAKLLYRSKNFNPKIIAVTNIGFGSLENPEKHRNVAFKTMEKGFYESGLLVNDVLVSGFSSFGVAAFYRYGAYRHDKTTDNLVLKLTAGFTF